MTTGRARWQVAGSRWQARQWAVGELGVGHSRRGNELLAGAAASREQAQ